MDFLLYLYTIDDDAHMIDLCVRVRVGMIMSCGWRWSRNTAALSQMDCGAKAEGLADVHHLQAYVPAPGDPYKDILHLTLPQVI